MRSLTRSFRRVAPLLALLLAATAAPAVNVVLDYSYATGTFFSTSTTNGQKARATVQAAADYFSSILTDSFPEVSKPDDYISSAPGGSDVTYSWNWQMEFNDPSTGSTVSISNPVIPADEFRIYVGARSIPGSTLGIGGPGGYHSSSGGSYYFQWQLDEINAINAEFSSLLSNRGQAAGDFGRWGGALTFDTTATWNYDHTVAPSMGQNDLLSVALHEIGHVLGFGTSDEFEALRSGSTFLGAESRTANGGAYPSLSPDYGHWLDGTGSSIFGGATSQETAMDPTITVGTRKLWTKLDAAALSDIGWEVDLPGLAGDYNADGLVNAADYTVWRDSLSSGTVIGSYAEWSSNYGATASASGLSIPEPTAVLLAAAGLSAGVWRRAS